MLSTLTLLLVAIAALVSLTVLYVFTLRPLLEWRKPTRTLDLVEARKRLGCVKGMGNRRRGA